MTLKLPPTRLLFAAASLLVAATALGQSTQQVLLSPSSLWFGEEAIGVSSQPKAVQVLNNALAATPLNLASITATGDYAQVNDCPATLAPGASCTISVSFTPSDRGRREGALTLVDDAAAGPQAVVLAGTGLRVSVEVRPGTAVLPASQPLQFQAVGSNTTNGDVTWLVDGVPGGNLASGTVSAVGLYSAPAQAGSHSVSAISQLDPAQTGAAQVSVTAAPAVPPPSTGIVADFGSRAVTAFPIAPSLFGAGIGGILDPATLPTLTQAGMTTTRFHASIQDVFADPANPRWAALDAKLALFQAAGMQVILEMDFTPASLRPTPNPCTGHQPPYAAYPTDLNAFAQMAAAYVSHIDHSFPGVVNDYEIWNEPDGGGLCTSTNSDASKLSKYLEIYAAVAPALRAASLSDGTSIRIGGPTLGSPTGSASTWITALLNNPGTSPYVDFVSFHYYPVGRRELQQGLTWDGANNTPSLYAKTQDPQYGMSAIYQTVAGVVSRESPTGTPIPIYLDEFNSDWTFQNDCCRNDPTYAPLWNSVAIVDVLNTVYSGSGQAPAKLLYYAMSNHPFCLLGVIDAQMDCAPALAPGEVSQPYPQFYAFQLFASPAYLGLQGGGYMAASVSSENTQLLTTAFYTGTADVLVIVNPTGQSFANVPVTAANAAVAGTSGNLYTLNGSNPSISTAALPLTLTSGALAGTLPVVPPHSTLAIAIPVAPPATASATPLQ